MQTRRVLQRKIHAVGDCGFHVGSTKVERQLAASVHGNDVDATAGASFGEDVLRAGLHGHHIKRLQEGVAWVQRGADVGVVVHEQSQPVEHLALDGFEPGHVHHGGQLGLAGVYDVLHDARVPAHCRHARSSQHCWRARGKGATHVTELQ